METTRKGSNFKLIESINKIYYFTKMCLELQPCLEIYELSKTIKENLLQHTLEPIKYFIRDCLYFTDKISDKEKIMSVFSIMFMHYYSKYAYDLGISFEDFYTQDLVNMFNIKGISCYKVQDFQIFSYTFFYETVRILSKVNYKELKKKYMFYSDIPRIKKDSLINSFQDYITIIKNMDLKNAVNTVKKCIKPLIATKEKIVEMIVKGNDSSSSVNNKVGSAYNCSDLFSNITNNSIETPKDIFSKRIKGELSQEEINESEKEFTNDIAIKVDSLVEIILNQGNNKVYDVRNFLCYIVEIESDFIRLFPEYEDIPDNIKLRVIIGARNLYLIALETYFATYDLYKIDLNSIMSVFKARYPFSYDNLIDNPVGSFFKLVINLYSNIPDDVKQEDVLVKIVELMENEWEEEINKKGKELTYFSKEVK